jgi:CBS domain-containing protein
MFQVYSIAGRVFSGSLEQWRQVAPTRAVARARRIAPVGHEAFEPGAAADGSAPPAATAATRRGVLAAYAAAAQSGQARRPLTCVADVMSRHVQTVTLEASVLQAWQALARTGFGQAPVVDGQGTLVGLFLRADLMRADLLERAAADAPTWQALLAEPVRALMWTPVPATLADTDLRRVATVLLDTGLPGLPVVDERGAVGGFVSRSDILRAVTADPPLDLWG